jgi:hypothetical protein
MWVTPWPRKHCLFGYVSHTRSQVTTQLPASEEAFRSGNEEPTAFIEEVFGGASYSSFASTIVTCHVFKIILAHVHRPKPSDKLEDVVQGRFWERHRELDNKISNLFMFMPAHLKLLNNSKDLASIHLNLNLHASIIFLHHAAIDMAEKHDLNNSIQEQSLARMRASATEIAGISKSVAHMSALFVSGTIQYRNDGL